MANVASVAGVNFTEKDVAVLCAMVNMLTVLQVVEMTSVLSPDLRKTVMDVKVKADSATLFSITGV